MPGLTLHHIVLHKLSMQPLSGYSLCTEIERSTGKRPSYGSIYPLLEKMTQEGLVTVEQQGRKKVYTLTAQGRATSSSHKDEQAHLFDNMITQSRRFCEITGCDPEPMVEMLERLKRGDDPLHGVSANALQLRDTLFILANAGKIQKNQKEINRILAETIKRLEKLQ